MSPKPFSATLLEGLAPDGGLAVPVAFPQVSADQLEQWRSLSYPELAAEVISLFATDIPREDIDRMTTDAYSPANFKTDGVVPLREIDGGLTLVGLSEGPTLAFKDMAMQFLGQVMEYVLEREDSVLNVLGATSGDTGSAAEYALRGKERVSVFMLSPQGRMSPFQRAQMYSLTDDNVHNIAVEGVFDDCQNLVKELAGDLEFKRELHLGAVNSINLARIVAQVVYYVWAWLRATDGSFVAASSTSAGSVTEGATREVSFTVPSGNFGNILSGYYAKQIGVPIRKLIVATNENNVLHELFQTGIYRPRSADETPATSSPSMDVSKASNFERFAYEILDTDPEAVAAAWKELDETGQIDLTHLREHYRDDLGFGSGTSTHADRIATIKAVREATGELIDPHTADAVFVARDFVEPGVPMLVLETAKPEKFSDTIKEATGEDIVLAPELAALLDAPQRVTAMANSRADLEAFIRAQAL